MSSAASRLPPPSLAVSAAAAARARPPGPPAASPPHTTAATTSQGYVLVYSITDDTTFSKLDRVREEIMRAQGGRPIPIFLVGTKKDLGADRAVEIHGCP